MDVYFLILKNNHKLLETKFEDKVTNYWNAIVLNPV